MTFYFNIYILLEWYNINKQYTNFSNEWFVFGNTRFYANTTIDDIKAEYYNLLEKEYNGYNKINYSSIW